MRQPQGYTIIVGPQPTVEMDTFTCAHCGVVQFVKPFTRAEDMGGICHGCGDKSRPSFICKSCVGKGCDPLEKKIERLEARGAALRSYGF